MPKNNFGQEVDRMVEEADFRKVKPDYDSKAPEGYIRLYHNTPKENLESIYKNGIVMAHPGGVRQRKPGYTDAAEGDTIWAINNGSRDTNGYGGNTIAFDVPITHKMQKVNDNEYILYEDVKPENFKFVDKVFAQGDRIDAGYRLSDLPEMVDIYKRQNKTKQQFKDLLNKYMPHKDYMSDEEFDYWINKYWG